MGCVAGADRRGWGMRSYRWRSQAPRAAAGAAPRAASRGGAIRITAAATRATFSRAALLGSVWLGALATLSQGAATCHRRHLDRRHKRRVDSGYELDLEPACAGQHGDVRH